MKLRELESALGGVRVFERPKVALEQYPTGAHLAACMLHTMEASFGELEGAVVADLGCGTGVLSVGAALCGAAAVVGVDVDGDALEIAQHNIDEYECAGEVSLLQAPIGAGAPLPLRSGSVDVVVMNPPFGTKTKGADAAFLAAARALRPRAVWSLHKSSTRAFLDKYARKTLGFTEAEVVAEMRYDLPKSYRFHKKASVDIEVDLWRFELQTDDEEPSLLNSAI